MLSESPVVTALADESTDISVDKRLVVYAQVVSPVNMQPSTHFLCNVQLTEATGKAIALEIQEQLRKRGVPPQKIM